MYVSGFFGAAFSQWSQLAPSLLCSRTLQSPLSSLSESRTEQNNCCLVVGDLFWPIMPWLVVESKARLAHWPREELRWVGGN